MTMTKTMASNYKNSVANSEYWKSNVIKKYSFQYVRKLVTQGAYYCVK